MYPIKPEIFSPVTLSPLDKYRGRGKARPKPTTITTVNVINKPHFVTFN